MSVIALHTRATNTLLFLESLSFSNSLSYITYYENVMFIECIILRFCIFYLTFVLLVFLPYSQSSLSNSKFFKSYRNLNTLSFAPHPDFSLYPTLRNPSCLFEKRKYKLRIKASGKFRIKPKTNHSVAKRFKITATGKLMYRRATTQHKQRHKSKGAKARLHRNGILTSIRMIRKIKSVLHNR